MNPSKEDSALQKLRRLPLDLDRFDKAVLFFMVALLIAILIVVGIGNNIGVQVESYSPATNRARSDTAIRIRFFSDMEQASVEERFRIEPPIEGALRWNGARELVFEPNEPLISGQSYQVLVAQGATATDNSALLKEDFHFNFSIAQPRLLYLHPASSQIRNLYLHDFSTGQTRQLTNQEWGVVDYALSADGRLIAYAIYKEDGTSDIWLLSLDAEGESQITNCVTAFCSAPTWHPDGSQILYERDEFDPLLGGVSARRIWTVDLQTAQSRLLFDDTQITGHSAHYGGVGNRLAMFSTNPPGVLVYDFISGERSFIDSTLGISGEFSPDGQRLLYPVLVRGGVGSLFYTQLEIVDLEENRRNQLVPTESPLEDLSGTWRPGHPDQIAVARRYFDDRYTDGPQIYLVDLATNETEALVVDGAYNHGSLRWSPDGNLMVMQRFNRQEAGARPQIWIYNMQTRALDFIADDAFLPRFAP